jgi:hypothetical protein
LRLSPLRCPPEADIGVRAASRAADSGIGQRVCRDLQL